jgi:hypothetical protein
MLYRSSLPTAAAVLAFAAAATAQVGSFYTFSQTVGAYSPITGGTVLGTATTANTLDDATFAVTLPFAFTYDNAVQTQVQVQTNGHIAFGTATTTTYIPLSDTIAAPGYVSACGRDLQGGYVFASTRTLGSDQVTNVSSNGPLQVGDVLIGTGIPTGTTITAIAGNTLTMSALATSTSTNTAVTAYGPWSEIRWETVGTAPNQEFVVQWSNFRRFGTGLTVNNGTNLNFQIRLHENGQIQCVYGNCSPGVAGVTTTALHQVGLRGPTNAFPLNVNNRFNTKGVNDDWSQSAAGTANTSGMLLNSVAPANVVPNGLAYTWAPLSGTVAANDTIGTGCGDSSNSFYQLFADAALAAPALSGNSLQLTPNGNGGYNGTWLPGTAASLYVTPVAPVTLATGDDGTASFPLTTPFPTAQGPQSSLLVSGNAIVAWGGATMDYPGSNSFTPTAPAFLNSTLGGVYAWHDYNQGETGSGAIQREEIGGVAYVTFNGVESYSTPAALNPSTLQFQFDTTTGNITLVFVSIDNATTSTFGSGHLVGVTQPGVSVDGGSVDLATAALLTFSPEVSPLLLTASNRPIQGAGPTSWDLVVSNIPATTVIGLDIFGLSDPNIPDLSVFGLGMPGCQLHASLDVVNAWVSAGLTHNYSLAIPPSPSLNNFVLYTQSACLGNGLLSDNITSNAIRATVGNL